jgi:hypothetical protein
VSAAATTLKRSSKVQANQKSSRPYCSHAPSENRNGCGANDVYFNTSEKDGRDFAQFLAQLARESPDLVALVRAWPDLPVAIRSGIMAMIKVAVPGLGSTRQ